MNYLDILNYLKFKILKLHLPRQYKFNARNYKYFDIVIVKLKISYCKEMNKIEIPN
jgi:hypothetical protein